MAVAGIDPKWNTVALSDYNFIASPLSFQFVHPTRPLNAAMPDGGVSSEATLGPATITMGGEIAETTIDTAWDSYGELMKLFRTSGDRAKKGQLQPFGGAYHWYCQLTDRSTFTPMQAEGRAQVSFTFVADDPFRRANSKIVKTATPASTVTIDHSSSGDFQGDAPRMPLTLNMGSGWASGNLIRLLNSTTGQRFECTVSAAITASEEIVINGDEHLIYEGTRIAMAKVAGGFLYVAGGMDNVIDFTGTTTLQSTTFEFWDRYWT